MHHWHILRLKMSPATHGWAKSEMYSVKIHLVERFSLLPHFYLELDQDREVKLVARIM